LIFIVGLAKFTFYYELKDENTVHLFI
jgi:hypothetical protein